MTLTVINNHYIRIILEYKTVYSDMFLVLFGVVLWYKLT